jgi:hypothetical protein
LKPGAVFYGDGGNGGIGLIVQYNAFDAVIAEVNVYLIRTLPQWVHFLGLLEGTRSSFSFAAIFVEVV